MGTARPAPRQRLLAPVDLRQRRNGSAAPPGGGWRFSIRTLLLVTAAAAVVLGVGSRAPALGVYLGLIVAGALAITAHRHAQAAARGRHLGLNEQLALFGLLVVVLLFLPPLVVAGGVLSLLVVLYPLAAMQRLGWLVIMLVLLHAGVRWRRQRARGVTAPATAGRGCAGPRAAATLAGPPAAPPAEPRAA